MNIQLQSSLRNWFAASIPTFVFVLQKQSQGKGHQLLHKCEYNKKTKTSRTPDQHGFPLLPRSKQTSFSKVAAVGEESNFQVLFFLFHSNKNEHVLVQKNSFFVGVDSSPFTVLGLLDFLFQHFMFSFFMPLLPQNINFRLYFQNIKERRGSDKKYD